MTKAVFLDRDGTINVEKQYLYKIEMFEFLPGVLEALQLLQNANYLLIIITNQSGIGRGYYLKEDFMILNTWMINILKQHNINITKVYYCPHLPDAKIKKYRKLCKCRKPAIGMFEQAIKEFDIDLSQSYTIGDKIRDCTICESTDCHGYLVGNNEKQEVIDAVKAGKYKNVRFSENFLECVRNII